MVTDNKFPYPLNIVSVSGFSGPLGPDLGAAQSFILSGKNIDGLIPSFPSYTGGLTNLEIQGFSNPATYGVASNGLQTLEVKFQGG